MSFIEYVDSWWDLAYIIFGVIIGTLGLAGGIIPLLLMGYFFMFIPMFDNNHKEAFD